MTCSASTTSSTSPGSGRSPSSTAAAPRASCTPTSLEPYHPAIRREILESAAAAGHSIRDGGVYACFEGPRFETRAEIRLAALAGADVAGMTGVPEVTLAAEAGLRYAAISLVVNPASGVGDTTDPITMDDIDQVLQDSAAKVLAILDELVHTRATFPDDETADMTTTRIENATYLVTVDENDTILTNATIEIADGVITSITTNEAGTQRRATEEQEATEGAEPEAERESSRRPLAGSGGGPTLCVGATASASEWLRMVCGRRTVPAQPQATHGTRRAPTSR